jgi:hypothetical protein
MMNLATLGLHRDFVVKVDPYECQIPTLTPEENAVLEQLGTAGFWLEQEGVPYSTVVAAFGHITSPD